MSNLLNIKAVIFDRDGVIINTDVVVIDSLKYAFHKIGFDLQPEDIPHIIGRDFDTYKHYFLSKWDFDPDVYRKIQREYFYEHLSEAKYFQHTLDLIDSLYAKKVPIAVTTSAGKEGTILILSKAGIDHKFNVITTKEDCKNLKPHPEPYLTTSTRLGIEPKFCLVIEDSALGVEAAKKAGMFCFAVPNEFTKNQDFSSADKVLDSTDKVEGLIELIT